MHQFYDEDDTEESQCCNDKTTAEDPLASKFLKTRQILLSGEIDKPLAEKIIRQLLILEAENHDPIYVYIDSPGGDADAGFAIFDMMRYIDAPVYTIGMGLVASAGSIILLAAPKERRFGLPNSHYLIHQPLSSIKGVATEIEIHAKEIEKVKSKINELIAAECGQSIKKVSKDTDRDFWLDATESVTYGLLSKIVASRKDLI